MNGFRGVVRGAGRGVLRHADEGVARRGSAAVSDLLIALIAAVLYVALTIDAHKYPHIFEDEK